MDNKNNNRKQLLILISGFSGSGRTTLAKELLDKLPGKFAHIDVKDVHNFLNKTYPVIQDDNTVKGKNFNLRQTLSKKVKSGLLEGFLEGGTSVIYDSANLERKKRNKILTKAKEIAPNLKTAIIYIDVPEETLLKELKARDLEAESRGLKPVWVDLYTEVQKKALERPKPDEADLVIEYTRESLGKVLSKLDTLRIS